MLVSYIDKSIKQRIMPHIQGENRTQMFMFCYEQVVAPDAFVRVIDAFVDALDLRSFGFSHVETHEEGRPSYHPGVLLKLYLYGYHYGIRSSRKLEREARLNMEVNWLLNNQHPKNRTISDFRKNHSKAFRDVFRRFVLLLKEWDLIENDTHALARVAISTKELLGAEHLNALADKGYHTGDQLKQCEDNNITTYVSPKAPSTKDVGLFPVSEFTYREETDTYICPAGNIMKTNGNYYVHSGKGKPGAYRFKRYVTPECRDCRLRDQCSASEKNGRAIDRSEYASFIEQNKQRVEVNPDYYRQRQQISEHMFGTLKRQRGFTFTLMKGKENVLSEVRLMFLCYNLGRAVSIMSIQELIKRLKIIHLYFFAKIRVLLSCFEGFFPEMIYRSN